MKTAKTTSCTGSLMTASPSHSRQGGSSSQQRPQRGGGGPLTHHRLGGQKITIRRRGRGTLRTMFTFEHSVAGAGVRTGSISCNFVALLFWGSFVSVSSFVAVLVYLVLL